MKPYLYAPVLVATIIFAGCAKDEGKNGADKNGYCTNETVGLYNEITTAKTTLSLLDLSQRQSVVNSCKKLNSVMGPTSSCIASNLNSGGTLIISYAESKSFCEQVEQSLTSTSIMPTPQNCSQKILDGYNDVLSSFERVNMRLESYADAKMSCDYFKFVIGQSSCYAQVNATNKTVLLTYSNVEKRCYEVAVLASVNAPAVGPVVGTNPNRPPGQPPLADVYDGRLIADISSIEFTVINEIVINRIILNDTISFIQNGKHITDILALDNNRDHCTLITTNNSYSTRNGDIINMRLNLENEHSISFVSADSNLYMSCTKVKTANKGWTVQEAKDTLNSLMNLQVSHN